MPRRNRRRHPRRIAWTPPGEKPKGKKRPRRYHRGREQDRLFEAAERRLEAA